MSREKSREKSTVERNDEVRMDDADLGAAVGGLLLTQTVTRAIETGRSGTARARAGTVLEEIEVEKEVD